MYLPVADPDLDLLISPGLQIRVWNLPDNRQSLPILVEWTSRQWNFFEYFALFQLITVNIENFLTNSGMPLQYKQYCNWWEVNQLGQMLQFPQHLFSAFFFTMTSCAVCIMTSLFYNPFLINSQYFAVVGGWQPCTLDLFLTVVKLLWCLRTDETWWFKNPGPTQGTCSYYS